MPMAPAQYTNGIMASVGNDVNGRHPPAVAAAVNDGAANQNSRSQRSGRSNRVLGDYTLGKTLGAGSMGKVKLAYHNITGEKVRRNSKSQLSALS